MLSVRILRPVLLVAPLLVFSVTAAEDAQSGADGRELYLSYQCWQCHGYEGQGGAAARVASVRYPFDAFVVFVRYPNLMPAYPPEQLGDDELRRIFEYLAAIPEPPSRESIPALDES